MKTSGKLKNFIWFMLLVVGIGLMTTGCQTYQQKNKVIGYWRQGNIPKAASEATKEADDHAGGKDAVVWRLEEGATLRADGQYAASNQAFEQAQQKIDDYA